MRNQDKETYLSEEYIANTRRINRLDKVNEEGAMRHKNVNPG